MQDHSSSQAIRAIIPLGREWVKAAQNLTNRRILRFGRCSSVASGRTGHPLLVSI